MKLSLIQNETYNESSDFVGTTSLTKYLIYKIVIFRLGNDPFWAVSSWRGVVDLQEANLLLKFIPEAVTTLNSYANICRHDVQEYCFLLRTNRKNNDN